MKTFKHGGGGGDMIFGLATMYNMGGGILHLNIDVKGFYKRLLERQKYVKKLIYEHYSQKNWRNFKVDVDLDLFRQQPFNTYTLLECHAMAQNIKFDFSKPWIFNIDPKEIAPIVINDTGKLRWPGVTLDWKILKDFRKKCVFIGLENEHSNFCRDRFKVDYYKIKDALEWSQIIKGGKMYVGNQSAGITLAEGMKVVRFVDLYLGKSKQYPKGEHGFFKISRDLIERYLDA